MHFTCAVSHRQPRGTLCNVTEELPVRESPFPRSVHLRVLFLNVYGRESRPKFAPPEAKTDTPTALLGCKILVSHLYCLRSIPCSYVVFSSFDFGFLSAWPCAPQCLVCVCEGQAFICYLPDLTAVLSHMVNDAVGKKKMKGSHVGLVIPFLLAC